MTSDSHAAAGFAQRPLRRFNAGGQDDASSRHVRERFAKPGSGLFADLPSGPAKA
jgi:hypothetical protein